MQGQEPIKHYFTQMNAHSYKHTDTHQHFHDKYNLSLCKNMHFVKYPKTFLFTFNILNKQNGVLLENNVYGSDF